MPNDTQDQEKESQVAFNPDDVILDDRKKEQEEFEAQEKGKRQKLERKIEEQYLKATTHEILCENAGLKLAKKITDHFDKKLTEHENELKRAIKQNGNGH